MKGLSPLVQSLILVSITIALAAIIFMQTTRLVNQQTDAMAQQAQKANCLYAKLALDYFDYGRADGEMKFVVNNNGKIGLENFTLYIYNATGIDSVSLATDSRVSNNQNAALPPGELRFYLVSGLGNGLTRFKITSECPDYGFIEQSL